MRERFAAEKRVLSFPEFLALVSEHPWRHTRDAARYLHDCFEHFGSYEVARPWGKVRRWRLFDLPFRRAEVANGDAVPEVAKKSDHLVGQEALQASVYHALQGFLREGRANRLLLLHGPNGSAKSTFAACLMHALEAYSNTIEGAVYRFSWIFPRGTDGKGIGFTTGEEGPKPGESYAHLPEERIDAKLPSELREHPLLLLPTPERRRLLTQLYAEAGIDQTPPDWLWSGQLAHKNRQVFDALLTAYRGDLQRVLAHVQVERWYVSRRYRTGAVTIGPQMAVDARERQITADRSLGSLPASLSAVTLFEVFGELVDAAGGVIEYSDLLKRPLDAWKYLLLAIESGDVALPLSNLPINSVMVASSNELHLEAFQKHPEYQSFRGRLVLLRAPYLRDHRQEQGIYDAQIVPQVPIHVAPHVTYVAALWAILTRLRRARPDRYEDQTLGRLAAELSPLEKADLYAEGTVPRRLSNEEGKVLASGIGKIFAEPSGTLDYEGLIGASPREMRMILLAAASDPEADCLAPDALLEQLEVFCARDDYEFLKLEPDRGYHDARGFVKVVRERWLDFVDDELRGATGLVDETQYLDLFRRYVTHVSHAIKKERVYNPVTGKYEEPDTDLMERVEEMLEVGEADEFRHDLMSRVANWAIDHPDVEVDYVDLFPRHIERLEDAYFEERKAQIAAIARNVLALCDGGGEVGGDERVGAEEALERLRAHGYEKASVRVALSALLKARYEDV
ncbi:MAG: protein kinase [Sandaracinus sp.]|nr:protein kinase [Myxococcales bacterium]MAT26582.1 protein kinase [Sandaracinus sp.]